MSAVPVAMTVNDAGWPALTVRLLGWPVIDAAVQPGVMVSTLVPVDDWPSGLVTVKLRAPVAAAPLTVTLRVREVSLLRVTVLTVMPAPEKAAPIRLHHVASVS